MNILDIVIDDEKYTYVDSIHINGKSYIVYTDGEKTYISEYKLINDNLEFYDIDDNTFNKVKEALKL